MVTTRHIRAGEELFTYYKYSPSGTFTLFPWYWELKEKIEKEEDDNKGKAKSRSQSIGEKRK